MLDLPILYALCVSIRISYLNTYRGLAHAQLSVLNLKALVGVSTRKMPSPYLYKFRLREGSCAAPLAAAVHPSGSGRRSGGGAAEQTRARGSGASFVIVPGPRHHQHCH